MIEEGELLLKLKMALEFNREFYPRSAFIDKDKADSILRSPASKDDSPISKISQMIEQTIALIKDRHKLYLIQVIARRVVKYLGLDIVPETDVQLVLAKAIAAMPTAHRLVARKDYDVLKSALPIIGAIATAKVSIETYGPSSAYDDLYSKVDILDQNLLHIAALNNDYRAIVMLMESKAISADDCMAEDIQGLTPLQIIVLNTQDPSKEKSHEALVILKLFLKKGWIKLDEPCLGNQTLLHFAARTNNALLCEFLLKLKAQVNVANEIDGNTPLHYACQYDAAEAAHILLQYKANPSIINRKGATPRQQATTFGSIQVLSLLTLLNTKKSPQHFLSSLSLGFVAPELRSEEPGSAPGPGSHSKDDFFNGIDPFQNRTAQAVSVSEKHSAKHFFMPSVEKLTPEDNEVENKLKAELEAVARPRAASASDNDKSKKSVFFSFTTDSNKSDKEDDLTTLPETHTPMLTSLKRAKSEFSLNKKIKTLTSLTPVLAPRSISNASLSQSRYEYVSPISNRRPGGLGFKAGKYDS